MTRRCRGLRDTNGGTKSNREAISSTGRGLRLLPYAIRENLLDYFWLSDVMMHHDSLGMRVERDPRWRSKRLDEIAPEMFKSHDKEQED